MSDIELFNRIGRSATVDDLTECGQNRTSITPIGESG